LATTPFKIGLSGCGGGLEVSSTREILELAVRAEQLGFHALWLNEEHFQGSLVEVEGRRCLSPLILAGAIAARTSRLRIGFSVLLLALHHPVRLAEEIATLDVLSDGRIDFGISRGSNPRYLQAYGIQSGNTPQAFEDSIKLIVRAWQPGEIDLGESRVSVEPKPVQHPHPPLYIGTYTEATAAAAARAGHRLICHGITSELAVARLIRAFTDAGGKADEVPLGRFVYVSATDASARDELWPTVLSLTARLKTIARNRAGILDESLLEPEAFYRHMVVAGSPETCVARIEALRSAFGINYLNALSAFFGFLPRPLLVRSLELLATEVRPKLVQSMPTMSAS
jgi:alkanesulfonate monooxygenase SsuD/methylene tetrahydromethanopterin reductase-like flavin-dependent oxidoreductase (luciferase family)